MSVASWQKKMRQCQSNTCPHYALMLTTDQTREIESRKRSLDHWKERVKNGYYRKEQKQGTEAIVFP